MSNHVIKNAIKQFPKVKEALNKWQRLKQDDFHA